MSTQTNHDLFRGLVDLAAEKNGGKTLSVTDEFFAAADNMLKEGRGVFIVDKFTENGKWMDGWESRRKRVEGYDHCIIKLCSEGKIKGLDIDTNHFLGNHPPFASVDACLADLDADVESLDNWVEILPKSALNPGSQNVFSIQDESHYTHLRLNIYPDGGVARFRVYGDIINDLSNKDKTIDLVSVLNCGKAVLCNDMFFSSMDNLMKPNRSKNMGDGWETRRKRILPGNDWVILKLGTSGYLEKLLIDTNHFKGNYPDTFSLEGCYMPNVDDSHFSLGGEVDWVTIVGKTKLEAHKEMYFTDEILTDLPFTHIRLNIFPDGGISRLRFFGKPLTMLDWLNKQSKEKKVAEFMKCCGSSNWANKMADQSSFENIDSVFDIAEKTWFDTSKEDWLEAFTHHPRIGDTKILAEKFAATKKWSEGEQASISQADQKTIEKLAKMNNDYYDKFGYIFIVCATGKSASEMLSILESRIVNSSEEELKNAMKEQSKITKIRLVKLLKV